METTKGSSDPSKKTQAKDTRRYYCDYCGISRSKKSLLTSHLLSHHKEEIEKHGEDNDGEAKSNTCEECGASFRKPAYLKQHMRSILKEYLLPPIPIFRILFCTALLISLLILFIT
ncbi:hypothetical protein ACHQM5_022631 [Ranunculus cassubicifolius]